MAMTRSTTTRRRFLQSGLTAATALGSPTAMPQLFARAAAAPKSDGGKGRVLVLLQLTGGNDGLNTVVPFRDDVYLKQRPKLRLAPDRLHKLNDALGLHASLREFDRLLQSGELAIVQGVGYPRPSRSHFESLAVWHAARRYAEQSDRGWLAHRFGGSLQSGSDPLSIYVGEGELPPALTGSTFGVPALSTPEDVHLRLGATPAETVARREELLDQLGEMEQGDDLMRFTRQRIRSAYETSARLEAVARESTPSSTVYPDDSALASRLSMIAQLIKAGLETNVYFTQLDGFDTHSSQLSTHTGLLAELGASLGGFAQDLREAGQWQRVLVLVYSEFGRRVAENGSAGTDHGTAAPVFLAGPVVEPGLHGSHPDLGQLVDGDPVYDIDFRQVYATLLDDWLGCSSEDVLGGRFDKLAVLQRPASSGAS